MFIAISDTPDIPVWSQDKEATANLLSSIAESRKAIAFGAILTRANIHQGSLKPIQKFDVICGIHAFPQTEFARADIAVRQPAPAGAPQPTQVSIKADELVIAFRDSTTYYLVPRDAVLVLDKEYIFTFLTLRNHPGKKALQYQVVTMSFDAKYSIIADAIKAHVNPETEVRAKMANAMKQIPAMSSGYLLFHDVVKPEPVEVVAPETKRQIAAAKKAKRASTIPEGWKCEICGVETTVMRRRGPSGLNKACNSCGQQWAHTNKAQKAAAKAS